MYKKNGDRKALSVLMCDEDVGSQLYVRFVREDRTSKPKRGVV